MFDASEALLDQEVTVPCGNCIGCRLDRSKSWAIRCVHEASLYERNCFITLTYSDEHLPAHGTLVLRDFQLFMKRLRKEFGSGIRFFHCGEYGARYGRPHYHACLFNFRFNDLVPWQNKGGITLYRSAKLEELWPQGFSTVGEVTFESAAYVARYIVKKVLGTSTKAEIAKDVRYGATEWKPRVNKNGEERWLSCGFEKKPEYTTMSRRPGLGAGWFEKFSGDVFPHDFVEHGGRKLRPPRFYDGLFEIDNPSEFRKIKASRSAAAVLGEADATPERLAVREEHQQIKARKLIRSYENAEDVHNL